MSQVMVKLSIRNSYPFTYLDFECFYCTILNSD